MFLKGNFLYTPSQTEFIILENQYIQVEEARFSFPKTFRSISIRHPSSITERTSSSRPLSTSTSMHRSTSTEVSALTKNCFLGWKTIPSLQKAAFLIRILPLAFTVPSCLV